jgi:alcohol dehydrogenase class IV
MTAVAPFRNHLPVKIRFGDGVSADLAGVLAEEGAARPLIVIDEGLAGLVPRVA